MRFVLIVLLFLAYALAAPAVAKEEVLQTSLKFVDVVGTWAGKNGTCARRNQFLFVSDEVINDSEIGCFVSTTGKTPGGWFLVVGASCIAEGHQLDDFQFYFRRTQQGHFEYSNSGEGGFIQSVQKCPVKPETKLPDTTFPQTGELPND